MPNQPLTTSELIGLRVDWTSYSSLRPFTFFFKDGKPAAAILALKFGVPEYGNSVIEKIPEMLPAVQRVEAYTYSEKELFKVVAQNPLSTLSAKVIEINGIAAFLNTIDANTSMLLNMIVFGEDSSIQALRRAFTSEPAGRKAEEFGTAMKDLQENGVVQNDGIRLTIPRHIQLILRTEILNRTMDKNKIARILGAKDPILPDLLELARLRNGTIPCSILTDKYKDEIHHRMLSESLKNLVEKGILMKCADGAGNVVLSIPVEVSDSIAQVRLELERGILKIEPETLEQATAPQSAADRRAELLKKFNIKPPDKEQIKKTIDKFYEEK